MEPISLVGAAAKTDPASQEAVKVVGNLMTRLFGPLADHWGSQLVEYAVNRNVQHVTRLAAKKALKSQEGSIPLRVAANILDQAQFADNEFVAEYLSGVLASARTPEGIDDRAVSWTALVGRMSSDQLRLHFILYSTMHSLLIADGRTDLSEAMQSATYINVEELFAAMFGPRSDDDAVNSLLNNRLTEGLTSLKREDLISAMALNSDSEALAKATYPPRQLPTGGGAYFSPSYSGVHLFLWGLGLGNESLQKFCDGDLEVEIEADVRIPVAGSALWDTFAEDPDNGLDLPEFKLPELKLPTFKRRGSEQSESN